MRRVNFTNQTPHDICQSNGITNSERVVITCQCIDLAVEKEVRLWM